LWIEWNAAILRIRSHDDREWRSGVAPSRHADSESVASRPATARLQGADDAIVHSRTDVLVFRSAHLRGCCEDLPIAVTRVAVSLGPAGIVIAISLVFIRALPVVAGTTSEPSRIVVVAVARSCFGLTPVVITIAVVRTAAGSSTRLVRVPLVVSRIAVAGIEIHGRATLLCMDAKQLLEQALRLSDEERAALAGELIQSLDSEVDADAEAAWSAEIRARLERVDAGTAKTISWAEARRRIHAAAGRGSQA
jgi:putative addiction module component (TIGR02574 family)